MEQNENTVVFQEEATTPSSRQQKRAGFSIAAFVISLSGGLIKNEKQAGYVLIGFVICALLISTYLLLSTGAEVENKADEYRDIRQFLPLQ